MANIIINNSQLTKETIEALNILIDSDINASSAFKLTRIIKEISSIIEDKLKMEKKILDKWTQIGEDGIPTSVKDVDGSIIKDAVNIISIESFTKEMNDLLSVENELNYSKINQIMNI